MNFFNNSIRFRYILVVLVAIALLAAIFSRQGSSLSLVIHWVLVAGLLFVLIVHFWADGMSESLFDSEKAERKAQESADHDNSRQLYSKWLLNIEKIVTGLNPEYHMGIFFLDPASGKMIKQNESDDIFLPTLSSDHEIVSKILACKTSIKFQENENREPWKGILRDQTWRGSETLLGHKFLYHNVPYGCILIYVDHFTKIHDRDAHILSQISKIFELGLTQMEEVESLETLHYYSQRVFSLYHKINHDTSLDVVLHHFGEVCNQLFEFSAFTISLKMPSDKKPIVFYSLGENSESWQGLNFDLHGTMHGYSILQEEHLITTDWQQDFPEYTRFGRDDEKDRVYSSVLSAPIILHEHGMGSIVLEKKSKDGYTPTDLQILDMFGETIGSILTWIYQYKSTHNEAMYDYLTGLLNRKTFLKRFNQEIQRAIRFQQSLVLLLLDLDKFKNINDTYGHLYGDYMLRTVSHLIQENVRDIDVVGRYGGEEFIVILVNTSKVLAEQVGRRITHSIATYEFEEHDVKSRITISGGMAQFPMDSDEKRALIKLADDALYRAKDLGRNRIVLHGSK